MRWAVWANDHKSSVTPAQARAPSMGWGSFSMRSKLCADGSIAAERHGLVQAGELRELVEVHALFAEQREGPQAPTSSTFQCLT